MKIVFYHMKKYGLPNRICDFSYYVAYFLAVMLCFFCKSLYVKNVFVNSANYNKSV